MSQHLPPAARAVHRAASAAIAAAGARDAEAFVEAGARLLTLDLERVRLVLGHVVRSLVERTHPDGVASEDLGDLLRETVTETATWWPDVDPMALLSVLTGAFGVHPDEPGPASEDDPVERPAPPRPEDVVLGGTVVAAHLLAGLGGAPATPYLDAAFVELARAETVELP